MAKTNYSQELKIGDRITYAKRGNGIEVKIKEQVDGWKKQVLLAWLIIWVTCGGYVLYDLIAVNHPAQTKIILLIFLAFWLYYLVRVGRAWLFLIGGSENISIDDKNLRLERRITPFSQPQVYDLDLTENLRKSGIEKKKFSRSMQDSFWVLGGERLVFDYRKRKVSFAMKLNEYETNALLKLLRRYFH